jgi:hypothetical protein
MAGYLILIALCVVGANAIPKPAAQSNAHKGRVGGDPPLDPFANAPHACMVLVFRSGLEPGMAALGGGSIISTRHVVTAAHLVQGSNTKYQVGFFPTPTTRRIFESTFRVIHEDYDNTDFSSDIALIFLQGTNTFPTANVIPISTDAAPPAAGSALTTVGFGFTAADSTGASSDPYAAVQLPATPCDLEGIVEADTHSVQSMTPPLLGYAQAIMVLDALVERLQQKTHWLALHHAFYLDAQSQNIPATQ